MKALTFFILSILLILSFESEENYGCKIPENKEKCCWTNPNGCCAPSLKPRICTQVLTTCCKTKIYDAKRDIHSFQYSQGRTFHLDVIKV